MSKTITLDNYAEAIPIEELVELARADVNSCSAKSDETIRLCADRVVRTKLCPCASSVDAIVEAVVDEYKRQMMLATHQEGS